MNVQLLGYPHLSFEFPIVEGCSDADSIVMYAIGESRQSKPSPTALKTCLEQGHDSVFEHISFTFKVMDVSRTLLAQLTRHRIASYTVESQRYNDYTKKPLRYVTPPAIAGNPSMKDIFDTQMNLDEQLYTVLIHNGIKPEDARFVLPEATACNLTFTMNARELKHAIRLRVSPHAQWEIKELFTRCLALARSVAPLTFQDLSCNTCQYGNEGTCSDCDGQDGITEISDNCYCANYRKMETQQ